MPKSFMVKNSKRWIPSRESREKEVRTAIAIEEAKEQEDKTDTATHDGNSVTLA
uniref:Uncharacterized protein n=1 Tax=Magallana gigas TaxID=29159 RepID=K1PLJ0_MAGGI